MRLEQDGRAVVEKNGIEDAKSQLVVIVAPVAAVEIIIPVDVDVDVAAAAAPVVVVLATAESKVVHDSEVDSPYAKPKVSVPPRSQRSATYYHHQHQYHSPPFPHQADRPSTSRVTVYSY